MTAKIRSLSVIALGLLSLSALPNLTPTHPAQELTQSSLVEDIQYVADVFAAGHAALQAQINVHRPIMATNFSLTRTYISQLQADTDNFMRDSSIQELRFATPPEMIDTPEVPNFYEHLNNAGIRASTSPYQTYDSFYTPAEQDELRRIGESLTSF